MALVPLAGQVTVGRFELVEEPDDRIEPANRQVHRPSPE
jgi:hypothetical protein